MKISGAVFDMDGTLLDSMYIWETVGGKYLESRNIKDTIGFSKIIRGNSLRYAAEYCKRNLNLEDSVEEIMDGINNVATEMYIDDAKPKNDIIEYLDKLRDQGVKMCVTTATDIAPVSAALRKNNMLDYFGKIFTESSVGKGKTEPDMFRQALKFLGTEKESTWIFEDALYAIKTAKNDGFNVVGIYDKSEAFPEKVMKLSDIYVHNYCELQKY